MKQTIFIISIFIFSMQGGMAQMPDDAFMMSKKELCLVAAYGQTSWSQYWEGNKKRSNANIGKFTSKMYMPMLGYGITGQLNIYASLPFIDNSSNAGNITGKKGWQDAAVSAKYQLFGKIKKHWMYSGFGSAGLSIPAGNYTPDFLPYSIGVGSRTAQIRLVLDATFKEAFYVTAQTGYVARSKSKLARSTYYTDRQYYSNQMAVPDILDGSVRLGFDHSRFRAEVKYAFSSCTTGTDIRLNDMPLPNNKMKMQSIGFHSLLWVPGVNGLGINTTIDKVIEGRNVGEALSWAGGVQYIFTPFKTKKDVSTKK